MFRATLAGSQLRVGKFWPALPLALLVFVTFMQPGLTQEKERLYRTLSVSGRGVESVSATLSEVNLGVEIQGKTAQEVQQEAARRSSAVVALLRSRNVEKLQT